MFPVGVTNWGKQMPELERFQKEKYAIENDDVELIVKMGEEEDAGRFEIRRLAGDVKVDVHYDE